MASDWSAAAQSSALSVWAWLTSNEDDDDAAAAAAAAPTSKKKLHASSDEHASTTADEEHDHDADTSDVDPEFGIVGVVDVVASSSVTDSTKPNNNSSNNSSNNNNTSSSSTAPDSIELFASAVPLESTWSWRVLHRNLVVLALAIASPLQLVALFVAGGDVPVMCFGVLVGAVLVAMTSRHVMRHVRARRALDVSLLLAAVVVGSLFTAGTVGVAVHRWTLFAYPYAVQPSQVRRPLYESVPSSDEAWLPVYDLTRVKFEVQRDHVGQFDAPDGSIVCVAPIAVRKQLAKEIHSRDDVPTNWAVCRGRAAPPTSADEAPFECAKFYLSVTGSDYDRANVLGRRAAANSSSSTDAVFATTTVARNALELCMLDWVQHTTAYDLRHVELKTAHWAMQAAKDSLQKWSEINDDQDNPLVTFDDDEDLRHLSFVRLIRECCSFETAHSSTAALTLLLIGNVATALYVALVSPWAQRRAVLVALLGFAAWLGVFATAMTQLALPIAE